MANEPEWHGIDKMAVSIDAPKAPPRPVNLVEAVTLVARAVSTKIAYHQREIAALQAALRPFHEAASPPPPTNALENDDAIQQLLTLASSLKGNSP